MINNKELLQYLPQFLEQTNNGVVVTDPNKANNPIVYVNQSSCNIFEYEKEDFLGKNCKFLQNELTNQAEVKQIAKAVQNQKPIFVTIKNFTKSGKLIYNNLSISPIYDENGKLKYFLGIQRDATKENLLQLKNQKLVQKEIDNTKFNTIGRLSGGLSHELNTPLTVINGTLEMMEFTLEEIANEDTKNHLQNDIETLKQEFRRFGNIIESLREVADTHIFQRKKINLYRTLIFSLRVASYKIGLSAKVILLDEPFDMELDRDNEVFEIFADPNRLEQLWLILIENALDQFAKKGTPKQNNTIKISILKKPQYIEVFFEDNGGGFEPEVLANIFTPFNTTTEHKGLGIGLIVARQIVEKHDFDIIVSNSDQGAIVKIRIPIEIT
jgi:PAS domain S-box-containing protein